MTYSYCRVSWMLAALLVLAAGCKPKEVADDSPVTPETPVVLKLNEKSQVFVGNRWCDLYIESNKLAKFLREKSERYRTMFEEYQVPLPKTRVGARTVEVLPIEVQIEIAPRANPNWITFLKRTCREQGFVNFTVKLPDA